MWRQSILKEVDETMDATGGKLRRWETMRHAKDP